MSAAPPQLAMHRARALPGGLGDAGKHAVACQFAEHKAAYAELVEHATRAAGQGAAVAHAVGAAVAGELGFEEAGNLTGDAGR